MNDRRAAETLGSLVGAVDKMRANQRYYFATRARPALERALESEREVDTLLERVKADPPESAQLTFYDRPTTPERAHLAEVHRRNEAERKKEATKRARLVKAGELAAGATEQEAEERAERVRLAWMRAPR